MTWTSNNLFVGWRWPLTTKGGQERRGTSREPAVAAGPRARRGRAMEERRRVLEVKRRGDHAPLLSGPRGRSQGWEMSRDGRVPGRHDESRAYAPFRETRAACRSGEPARCCAVIGSDPVRPGSVGSRRRTARRRRYAEGPTKVAGGAGLSAAEGAPARAGYRAGTPLHRPPLRGAQMEMGSRGPLAPEGRRRPLPASGRRDGRATRHGPPATPSIPTTPTMRAVPPDRR